MGRMNNNRKQKAAKKEEEEKKAEQEALLENADQTAVEVEAPKSVCVIGVMKCNVL